MGQILYQYTDAQALAGIVADRAIRATDFRYLNDSLELSYVWDEFVVRLRALADAPDGGRSQAYATMLDAIRRLEADDIRNYDQAVFVACFTELKDEVSQWSRYGANGHGVALGFDAEKIATLQSGYHHQEPGGSLSALLDQDQQPVTFPAWLKPVEYGEDARDKTVAHLIGIVRDLGSTGNSATDAYNYISALGYFFSSVPQVKHAAFRDEHEHRITASEHFGGMSTQLRRAVSGLGEPFATFAAFPKTTLDVKFRPSPRTLFTPYVELPLPRDALVTVVLGPSVTDPLAPASVKRMLERHGYLDTTVEKSDLPYQS